MSTEEAACSTFCTVLRWCGFRVAKGVYSSIGKDFIVREISTINNIQILAGHSSPSRNPLELLFLNQALTFIRK